MVVKKKAANLKAFWKVILPVGDKNYFENDAMEDWVYGNHIGSMTIQLGWNINKAHQVQAYVDDIFEDGSGMRKGNGWDGLYGIQYKNRAEGRQYVRGAVVEYLQTTNQSGPIHWDSGDFPEPIRSQITDLVTGDDNYYNHMFYGPYDHYGMAQGNALLVSPIYNKDALPTSATIASKLGTLPLMATLPTACRTSSKVPTARDGAHTPIPYPISITLSMLCYRVSIPSALGSFLVPTLSTKATSMATATRSTLKSVIMAKYFKLLAVSYWLLAIGSLTACQEGGDAGDLFGQWRLDGSDSKYISFSGAVTWLQDLEVGEIYGTFQHQGDSLFMQCYSKLGEKRDTVVVEQSFGFSPINNIRLRIVTLDNDNLTLSKDGKT